VVKIVIQRSSREEPSDETGDGSTRPLPETDSRDARDSRDDPFGDKKPPGRRALARVFPRWLRWTGLAVLILALVGSGIALGWSWKPGTGAKRSTSDGIVGPWVLQKIEGNSKPALGTENFTFLYKHKVTKSIGPWPCWYSSTFYAVGHASATVDLNPGPSWWKPSTGHYRLRVLRSPVHGRGGRVAVTMTLPSPQLPQSVHDVTIDNTLSKPVSTSHSWTYPGLGCGALLRPQFAQSVVYAGAQQEAFSRVRHVSSVTRPLISAAQKEATTMVRDNFIQPTLNSLGYTLTSFTLRWAPAS